MPTEQHHQGALIETARAELDRAHRAAIAMEAAEVRRGLGLAQAALQEASTGEGGERYRTLAGQIAAAQTDLAEGALAEMAKIIEDVRKAIEA